MTITRHLAYDIPAAGTAGFADKYNAIAKRLDDALTWTVTPDGGDMFADIMNALDDVPTAGAGARSGGVVLLAPSPDPDLENEYHWVSSCLTVPLGATLIGLGRFASIVKALPSHDGSGLLKNLNNDGSQQNAAFRDIGFDGNYNGGARCGRGLIFDPLFDGTAGHNFWVTGCSEEGLVILGTNPDFPFGQALFQHFGCDNNRKDQILVEGAFSGLAFEHFATQSYAAGYNGMNLEGAFSAASGAYGVEILNYWSENDVANAAMLKISEVSSVHAQVLRMGGAPQSGQCVVRTSGTNQDSTNSQNGCRGVHAQAIRAERNAGFVIVDDQVRGKQVIAPTAPAVLADWYSIDDPGTPTVVSGTTQQNVKEYPVDVYVKVQGHATLVKTLEVKVGDTNDPAAQYLLIAEDIPPLAAGGYGTGMRVTRRFRVPAYGWFTVTVQSGATIVEAHSQAAT